MTTARSLVLAGAGLLAAACARDQRIDAPQVHVSVLPEPVHTVTQGAHADPSVPLPGGHADPHNLTWLFHVVLQSREAVPLSIRQVDVTFSRGGSMLWQESLAREYLERLEWLQGAFELTTEYYLTRTLHGREEATGPDLPAGGAVSWLRVPFARPWFAGADRIDLRFHFQDPGGGTRAADHSVPLAAYAQRVRLRLPFAGVWAVNAGNDLSTGHRRMGLNGLTNYGWDFVKLGPDGSPYRTNGATPQDYYTYGEPALAAGDGTVVHVRNDIPEFDIGAAPPADLLRRDGDVFAGNLVVLDHGAGEFSLTSHLLAGSVRVKPGDRVSAGDVLGRIGNSGYSGVPHIHFNLMDGGEWLKAKGLPSFFSQFERIRTGGPPQRIDWGNPVTSWFVRSIASAGP